MSTKQRKSFARDLIYPVSSWVANCFYFRYEEPLLVKVRYKPHFQDSIVVGFLLSRWPPFVSGRGSRTGTASRHSHVENLDEMNCSISLDNVNGSRWHTERICLATILGDCEVKTNADEVDQRHHSYKNRENEDVLHSVSVALIFALMSAHIDSHIYLRTISPCISARRKMSQVDDKFSLRLYTQETQGGPQICFFLTCANGRENPT